MLLVFFVFNCVPIFILSICEYNLCFMSTLFDHAVVDAEANFVDFYSGGSEGRVSLAVTCKMRVRENGGHAQCTKQRG